MAGKEEASGRQSSYDPAGEVAYALDVMRGEGVNGGLASGEEVEVDD